MTDSAKNFLPKFKSAVNRDGKKTIKCLKRKKQVDAKPEEHVRQRVLNWLINLKKWPIDKIRLEKKYDWFSDADRSFIRPDIELLDKNENVKLVIECKAENVKLTESVAKQAKENAQKAKAKNIWMTNGIDHKFLVKSSQGWKSVEKFDALDVKHPSSSVIPNFPKVLDSKSVKKFLSERYELGDDDFRDHPKEMKQIALALYKLFFHTEVKLPYSGAGFHILEDCGPMQVAVGNRAGGGFDGCYRGFVVANSGRVETLLLGVSYAGRDYQNDVYGIQINVATLAGNQTRHILQLSLTEMGEFKDHIISRNKVKKFWEISHDGSMAGIKVKTVLEALRESDAEHLLYENKEDKEMVKLGKLPFPESKFTWSNSKELIVNLLHYGLIRYNRRLAYESSKEK